MKIKRVSIDSFGGINGYFADFSDGNMILVYGDNEAGKSTVSEFIRGTIFNGKNAKYPVQKKTDHGYVEVEMENGETKLLRREGRRVFEENSKTLPTEDLKIDAETYRSLFSFDIEQIADDRMISNGDFRRKFLTVPGGEHVPEVSESIRSSMSILASKEKLTDTRELGRLRKRFREAEDKIASCNERTEGYNELVTKRDKLSRDLEDARMLQNRDAFQKNREFMFKSLQENTDKLEALRKRRDEISYAGRMTDEDIRKYDELKARLYTLEGLIDSGALDENGDEMTAQEVRSVMSMSAEINEVWASRARMEILEGAITDIRESIDRDSVRIAEVSASIQIPEENMERMVARDSDVREVLRNPDNRRNVSQKTVRWFTRRKRWLYSIVGLGAAGFSLIKGYTWAVIPLITAVFVVNSVPSLISGYCRVDNIDWPKWLESRGFVGMTTEQEASEAFAKIEPISYLLERRALSRDRLEKFEQEMHELTMRAREVTSKMKIGTGSVFRDLNEMYRIYTKAKELSEAFSESNGLVEKKTSVEKELRELVSKFGTETDFVDTRVVRDELVSINIRIKELESALKSAQEASSDVMMNTINDVVDESGNKVDPAKLIESINFQIGEVTTEMRHIINDDELSECLVEKGTAEKDFMTALHQWAVYAMADHIIADCCDRFYSDLQPSVVKTANRYLDLMTNGRYRLGSDPRDSTLFIEDIKKDAKHVSEWSSGLSDQVYLSVKMAIAKEMGSEKLPMVIDDIMVRFDARRKQGACRALMEFSQDQQVIMFTCDSSLVSMFRMEGKVNYMEMH